MRILRQSIEFAKNYFKGKTNIIVEVGVAGGHHAEEMILALNPEVFYLIDYYRKGKPEHLDIQIRQYAGIVEKIKSDNRYKLIEDMSHIACGKVPNELDLVYIDADHSYDEVKRDIACWYPKVKIGGILCGHDWAEHGVKTAVQEAFSVINPFASRKKHVGWGGDWWIVKNKEKERA